MTDREKLVRTSNIQNFIEERKYYIDRHVYSEEEKEREVGELLFAHRYKFTHSARWRRLHRALKRGEVSIVESSKEGKLFKVIGENVQL